MSERQTADPASKSTGPRAGSIGSTTESTEDDVASHAIEVHLDQLLADRQMTLTQLAERVGVTLVNLSVLKNGRAKAIRFSTLTAICRELGCQPGDLLAYRQSGPDSALDSSR